MESVIHFFGQISEFFLTRAVWGMWTYKESESHDCSGKRSAGTTCLSHPTAEAGTKLLCLFGRESSVKAMIKHQQERFRTAQFVVFIKVFSTLAYEFNDIFVLR